MSRVTQALMWIATIALVCIAVVLCVHTIHQRQRIERNVKCGKIATVEASLRHGEAYYIREIGKDCPDEG